MKIYKKSKRSAAVPLTWFYSTLAVKKPPRCRHWRRIRSSHSTSAYNQYIPTEPQFIFHFQVDLNVLQVEMCGKRVFFRIFRIFLAGEEMRDKPYMPFPTAGVGADSKANRARIHPVADEKSPTKNIALWVILADHEVEIHDGKLEKTRGLWRKRGKKKIAEKEPVSYTHLTLPTKA